MELNFTQLGCPVRKVRSCRVRREAFSSAGPAARLDRLPMQQFRSGALIYFPELRKIKIEPPPKRETALQFTGHLLR
jgi:hypothetical protein